jgi:hypothetical protein
MTLFLTFRARLSPGVFDHTAWTTLALNNVKPALPYIWRLIALIAAT